MVQTGRRVGQGRKLVKQAGSAIRMSQLSMRMPHGEPGRADSQRGSILVAASVFLIVGLLLLGSIQIGYMYYMKREMPNAADQIARPSRRERACHYASLSVVPPSSKTPHHPHPPT